MDLEKRLRSRGYRVTPQREAVFRVLERESGRPLSPEQIHRLAARLHAGLGLATVYRTLDLFRELGIASRVHLFSDKQHYELAAGKHHHHMICLSCGGVETFDTCLIDELKEMVRDGSDFLVTSHSMSLFGYCPRCLEGGSGPASPLARRGEARRNEKDYQ